MEDHCNHDHNSEEKYEIKYHPPEWIRILREYCRKDYGESGSGKPVLQQKNKRKNSLPSRA